MGKGTTTRTCFATQYFQHLVGHLTSDEGWPCGDDRWLLVVLFGRGESNFTGGGAAGHTILVSVLIDGTVQFVLFDDIDMHGPGMKTFGGGPSGFRLFGGWGMVVQPIHS